MKVLFMRFLELCVIILVIGTMTGCGSKTQQGESNYKKFTEEGFKITLPSEFAEKENPDYTYFYESNDVTLSIKKQDFTSFNDEWINAEATINDFVDFTMMNDNTMGNVVTSDGDTAYYSFEMNEDGENTYSCSYAEKGEDAFWLCTFTCNLSEKDKEQENFKTWSETIEIE